MAEPEGRRPIRGQLWRLSLRYRAPGLRGPEAGPEQSALLNFLRQHGSYQTPGHGITLTSAIAAVLRGVILNLLVWVPILVWVMILLLALSALAGGGAEPTDRAPAAFEAFLWTAVGLGGLFLLGCLAYSISTYSRQAPHAGRYLAHRLFESRAFLLLWPLLAAATLASLPYAADASVAGLGQFGGAAFIALGLAIGLWGFFRPESSWVVGLVRKRALPLGALLALYGVLLFAYQSAAWLQHRDDPQAWAVAALLLALAILSGWFVNLNYISMQRYYRDRLVEAFMPDLERALAQQGGAAAAADGLPLWVDPLKDRKAVLEAIEAVLEAPAHLSTRSLAQDDGQLRCAQPRGSAGAGGLLREPRRHVRPARGRAPGRPRAGGGPRGRALCQLRITDRSIDRQFAPPGSVALAAAHRANQEQPAGLDDVAAHAAPSSCPPAHRTKPPSACPVPGYRARHARCQGRPAAMAGGGLLQGWGGARLLSPHWAVGNGVSDRHFATYLRRVAEALERGPGAPPAG